MRRCPLCAESSPQRGGHRVQTFRPPRLLYQRQARLQEFYTRESLWVAMQNKRQASSAGFPGLLRLSSIPHAGRSEEVSARGCYSTRLLLRFRRCSRSRPLQLYVRSIAAFVRRVGIGNVSLRLQCRLRATPSKIQKANQRNSLGQVSNNERPCTLSRGQ